MALGAGVVGGAEDRSRRFAPMVGWRTFTAGFAVVVAVVLAPAPAAAEQTGWTARVQAELAGAGFYRGPVDGIAGLQTEAAILAFHKAAGLDRATAWRPDGLALLRAWDGPGIPDRRGEQDRVEIDLTRQILVLVRDGTVEAVMGVSSGNGGTFINSSRRKVRATTPEGDFSFVRHVDGLRRSYLGLLYRPWYFRGGYAIHGSPDVPAHPASHGCVRITNADADYLSSRVFLGMPVHVWRSPEPFPPLSVPLRGMPGGIPTMPV